MNMKTYLLFLILFLTISCKTKKFNDYKQSYFIENYKGVFFKNCLKKGFSNSKEIKILLEKDKSYNSDFLLGINNYKKIDSISKAIYTQIQKDSIKSIDKAEGSSGSKIFEYCLCAFSSKKIDSLAKEAYEKHISIKY